MKTLFQKKAGSKNLKMVRGETPTKNRGGLFFKSFLGWFICVLIFAIIYLIKDKENLTGLKGRNPSVDKRQTAYNFKSSDNITWAINTDYIGFQYKRKPSDFAQDEVFFAVISRSDYPQLFENLNNNLIKVVPFNVGGETFYLLSNVFYESAGLSLHYALIIDIWNNNQLLFETKESHTKGTFPTIEILDNGDIKISSIRHHFDFCRSCGFSIFDYLGYKEGKGFLTKNTFYKEEFRKLLREIENNNKCFVENGGKQLTFEEVKSKFGENFKCKSSQLKIQFEGITPKEYFELKDKVKKILNNQEVSLI